MDLAADIEVRLGKIFTIVECIEEDLQEEMDRAGESHPPVENLVKLTPNQIKRECHESWRNDSLPSGVIYHWRNTPLAWQKLCSDWADPMWPPSFDEKHAAEKDGWRKNRLLAIKLAARGEQTSAEIANLYGIARCHLFRWLAAVKAGGLEAFLKRDKPGPKDGSPRGVDAVVLDELKAWTVVREETAEAVRKREMKESRLSRATAMEQMYQSTHEI